MGGKPKPYDYEVDYLECTGEQYIDTGIQLVESTDVVTVTMSEPSIRKNGSAWGSRRTSASSYLRGVSFYDSASAVRVAISYTGGTGAYSSYGIVQVGSPVTVTTDFVRQTWTANGESGTFVSRDTANSNILLFSSGLSSSPSTSIRIHGFSVVRGGDRIINLIPVSSRGEGCMHDRVSGRLFRNAGTGSLIAGPRI